MIIMSLLNCKIFTPLSVTASPRMGLETAAIFGALAPAIGSIAGAGGQVFSNLSTNAANEALTREGWQLQQAEAEKARQFNSVEAQKAREYYSESAVMERRRQAGLNTAMDGSSSATSGASASASPGSISSPIPMQSLDAISLGNGLSQAISNYFGFKNADFQGKKINAETAKMLQDIVHDKAMFEVSLRMQNQNLENLRETTEQLKLKNVELNNAIRIQRLHTTEVHNQFYNEWVTREMAKNNVKIEGGKFLLMYEKDLATIKMNARNFANELRLRKTDLQFRFGSRHSTTSNNGVSSSGSSGSSWNVNASVSARATMPVVGGSVNVEGGYTSSQQKTTSETSGISSSSESTFANSDVGQMLARVEGALLCLENPNLSDEVKKNAIDIILRANYSFEAYQLYYEKLRKHVDASSPLLNP